jgi:subtilisin-like proprotein convertase family protein
MLRMHAICLICVGAWFLALSPAGSPQLAEAGKRHKTVTRTFANIGQIAIPGNGQATPYPVLIHVADFKKGKIKDINVTLQDFSHEHPDHVDILLVAPDGRTTLLLSDVGGSDPADNLTLTLDDQALAGVPLTSQLTSGTFRPTNEQMLDTLPAPAPLTGPTVALAVFNGASPTGTWQLFIRDDTERENGAIRGGWSLEIRARVKK